MTRTTLDCIPYDAPAIIESSNGDSDCLDLMFYNYGDVLCFINGVPLRQYATMRWTCNEGEKLVVKVNITFDTTGTTAKCYMIRRRIIK